jgi:hypothetical protein
MADPILLTCANCGKRFFASQAQRTSHHGGRKYGYCCSSRCSTLVGRRGKGSALGAREFARIMLASAIRNGQLVRPESCERCGAQPGLDRLGRSLIHGHHRDYNKPLEVEWICVRCHNNDPYHPRARGSANPNSSLQEEHLPDIRAMLGARVPHWHVALRFGVSKATITQISQGKTWKHVGQGDTP